MFFYLDGGANFRSDRKSPTMVRVIPRANNGVSGSLRIRADVRTVIAGMA